VTRQSLTPSVLEIDCAAEVERIASRLRAIVVTDLRRRGVVVAVSGGVDSAVCTALAERAFGAQHVVGLLLPEHESADECTTLGLEVVRQLGVPYEIEDIGPALAALGCYQRRDEAIRRVVPEYGPGWTSKLVIANNPAMALSYFRLIVQDPAGQQHATRLPAGEYREIVAATSFKQRLRKVMEYFYADRFGYAVVGTANRLEHDQGFFVKNGDGAADVKPIAHLYKTQVYALARHLGLPRAVCEARPTTGTYTLMQGQEEFYFSLPLDRMDLALWARNHGWAAAAAAASLGLTPAEATAVWADIDAKRRATAYLHARAALVVPVEEVGSGP
jgi:NAD+ synthase